MRQAGLRRTCRSTPISCSSSSSVGVHSEVCTSSPKLSITLKRGLPIVLPSTDYGVYLAIALVFVTKLFDLFRLNWWPRSLGGSISYVSFWSLALFVGYLLHRFRLDGFRSKNPAGHPGSPAGDFDWQRKTTWVLLAFATMALPALACFAKLRADRRNSYRRDLTPAQKT